MGLNRTIAVKASGAIGASTNSTDLTNRDCAGVMITLKTTAVSGTNPTLDVKVQELLPGAGYVDITGATFAQVTGAGTQTLIIHPVLTAAANTIVKRPLGRTWRLVYTIGGTATPTVTFSVDAQLVN